MIKNLRIFMMTAAFAVVLGCSGAAMAQIAGGYKTAKVDDADVKAAAEFAVGAQNKVDDFGRTLMSIKSAEKQVVAGMNYRLCLKVKMGGDEGETRSVKTVVYMDLKKNYKLTSWEDAECGSAAAAAPAAPARPPIAGGYKAADKTAEDVVAAAEFAVDAQNKKDDFGRTLIGVLSAEKQVVAGTNYRICLKSKLGGDEGEMPFVSVVVYMDLKKVYKLTSWTDTEECAAKDTEN